MFQNTGKFVLYAVNGAARRAVPAAASNLAKRSAQMMSTVSTKSAGPQRLLNTTSYAILNTRTFCAPAASGLADIFTKLGPKITGDIVKSTKAVYQFDVKEGGSFFIDLKNGDGAAGSGASPNKADVILTASEANFLKIFSGDLNPTAAFMTGKLKLKGDLGKATLLSQMLSKVKV